MITSRFTVTFRSRTPVTIVGLSVKDVLLWALAEFVRETITGIQEHESVRITKAVSDYLVSK